MGHHRNKKIISVPTTKILIKYKRIKWTPTRKASLLLPTGGYILVCIIKYRHQEKTNLYNFGAHG